MLMHPKIDDLLEHTDSRFTLVIAAAKRARQVNNYYRHLGEGLGQETAPQVQSASNKPLTIALEEIAQDKLEYERIADGIK
jgi:DNA-directed RNA polymerase subunit omega